MEYIDKYMDKWSGSDDELAPCFILVGGYIGTGKSTLSDYISKMLKYANVVATGVLRSIIYNTDKEKYSALSMHTFDFNYAERTRKIGQSISERIFEMCLEQSMILSKFINGIYQFSRTEKQLYIIDGGHVFPSMFSEEMRSNSLFLGCKASYENYHIQLSGPNHKRSFTKEETDILWEVHEMVVAELAKSDLQCVLTEDLLSSADFKLDRYLEKLIYQPA